MIPDRELLARASAVDASPVAFTSPRRRYEGSEIRRYNAVVRQTAMELGVPCVDLEAAFEDLDRDALILEDNIHPSEAGAEAIAEWAERAVTPLLSRRTAGAESRAGGESRRAR